MLAGITARESSLRLGVGYWAVVYAIEKRLGVFPIDVVPGRVGNEIDRLYVLTWWQRVRLNVMLKKFGKHPTFSLGREVL